MTLYSLPIRRRQVAAIIARDPWTIQVVRSEKNSSDDPSRTTWSFTGAVHTSGPYRGLEQWSRRMEAANPASSINFCLLAAYNETCPKARDIVTATHVATGIIKKFAVVSGSAYPFKVEATLNELQ